MAQHITIVRVDDFDGSSEAVQVTFGFQGVDYEIDLSEDRLAELETALAPYIEKGRRVGGRRQARGPAVKPGMNAKIREWARSQGIEIAARGRIPAEVVAAYEKAN